MRDPERIDMETAYTFCVGFRDNSLGNFSMNLHSPHVGPEMLVSFHLHEYGQISMGRIEGAT